MEEKWKDLIIGQVSVKIGKVNASLGVFHDCMRLFEVLLWFGSWFSLVASKIAWKKVGFKGDICVRPSEVSSKSYDVFGVCWCIGFDSLVKETGFGL